MRETSRSWPEDLVRPPRSENRVPTLDAPGVPGYPLWRPSHRLTSSRCQSFADRTSTTGGGKPRLSWASNRLLWVFHPHSSSTSAGPRRSAGSTCSRLGQSGTLGLSPPERFGSLTVTKDVFMLLAVSSRHEPSGDHLASAGNAALTSAVEPASRAIYPAKKVARRCVNTPGPAPKG
jgi:hypothetical protein